MQLISFLAAIVCLLEAATAIKLVCYFTNWAKWRPGTAMFTPTDVDPHLCTHIIYAFAKIENNRIAAFDPDTDIGERYYESVTRLKRVNPALKVYLAVGGWNQASTHFSPMSRTAATRQIFIRSVVRFLRLHNFDGLDLDWEYPAKRGGVMDDRPNYSALIRELMDAFRRDPIQPRLELTAAVPVSAKNLIGYERDQFCQHLDFVLAMTYDFHGAWENVTGPNAPLYAKATDEDPLFNTLAGLKWWDTAGCTRDKLIMGIPLYARTWNVMAPMGAPPAWGMIGSPGTAGPSTRAEGILAYHEFCRDVATTKVDPHYMVYYGMRNGNQFYNFDGVETMRQKAHFIRYNGLGGAMIWALDFDDFNARGCGQGKYPLINGLKHYLFNGLPKQNCNFNCPMPFGVYGVNDACGAGMYVCNGQISTRYNCPLGTRYEPTCTCCR